MEFRLISDADVPSLFAVRAATRENALSRDHLAALGITEDSVRNMLRRTHQGWLCEEAGSVIGFAMGNRETGEMWVLAVLPEFEGRGVGRTLLALVEDWLWSCGWPEVWLTTDTDTRLRAYGFYRSQGWLDSGVKDGARHMRKRNPKTHGSAAR